MKKLVENKVLVLITVLITVVLSTCVTLACYMNELIKIDNIEYKLNAGYSYCELQHESNPLNKNFSSFQNLYKELLDSESYTYYEIQAQPLYITSENQSFFDKNTEELSKAADEIKCIQVSQNVFEDFNISLYQGEMWSKGEFNLEESRRIPVLMGYEYNKEYKIGDTFSGEYLFDNYTFYVTGFLNQNSNIITAQKEIMLDKAILMPSFNVSDKIAVTDGLKIHYANKTSGMIRMSLDTSSENLDKIHSLIDENDAGEYSLSISPISTHFKDNFLLSMSTYRILLIIIAVLMMLTTMVLFYKILYKLRGYNIILFACIFGVSSICYSFVALVLITSLKNNLNMMSGIIAAFLSTLLAMVVANIWLHFRHKSM